jgi:DNA-binding beta-propeller fold protein YncE
MTLRTTLVCAAIAAVLGCAGYAAGPADAATAAPASRALSSPPCSTAAAKGPLLSRVPASMVKLPGHPFGVSVTPDGQWAFVALAHSVEVLRLGRALAPVKVRAIAMPRSVAAILEGTTLTWDGRYLLAAAGSGAVVISVARAERGTAGAVLGTLTDPHGGNFAIEVAISRDDRFAFVTQEYDDRAVVFNLGRALARGFGSADYVGAIPLGPAAVGMAVSPDGRWLYATSEGIAGSSGDTGTLRLISVPEAETDPARSVVTTVKAGCEPVRVIASANGSLVWVTARASDDLLCFSAARLRTHPAAALIAITRVGEAPVGLALVRGGTQIVVADSNRFDAKGATAELDVVNVAEALAGKNAVTGHIPSGLFPREMAIAPGGTRLLVGNFLSGQLEVVDTSAIP